MNLYKLYLYFNNKYIYVLLQCKIGGWKATMFNKFEIIYIYIYNVKPDGSVVVAFGAGTAYLYRAPWFTLGF